MKHSKSEHNNHPRPYFKLGIMLILSFICMYVLMYAMVSVIDDAIPNINQFYMAALMTMPMIIIELILMRNMYPNKKANYVLIILAVAVAAALWLGIRTQFAVSDKEFVKSMIPHHSGAILMCEKANLSNQNLVELCDRIIEDQKSEIEYMRSISN